MHSNQEKYRTPTSPSRNRKPNDHLHLAPQLRTKQFDEQELEAVNIHTKSRFTEGQKSARYFFSLEKHSQAEHSINTLTKDNLDTITDTRTILQETHNFYKSVYTADETNLAAQTVLPHSLSVNYTLPSSLWKTINLPASKA